MQRSSGVTAEKYMDIVDLVIGKAEQLFACPGSGSIFPYKTEVCDFIAREKAFETAIADDIPASSCSARANEWCGVHEMV